MARDIGSAAWLLIIWLVTGLITVAAALSGELAGMMPKAGGQFVYIQRIRKISVVFMAGLFYRYSDWSYCCNCSYVCKLFCDILSGIRYYTFRLGDSFVFPTSKLLAIASIITRSSILKGLKAGN
jgi:APA family basic amino acid/polyamine antiporter